MTHTLGQYLTACRSTTSIREVARRSRISEGQVRNYEHDRVTRPQPAAVALLTRTVQGDVPHALRLAGFNPDHYPDLLADPKQVDEAAAAAAHDEWFSKLGRRDREKVIGNLIALHATLANLEE